MSPPVLVILNPASSSGKAARLRDPIARILRRDGVDFELVATRGPDHAADLAAAGVARGCSTVVAVGGDGTVHEVARGLLGSPGVPSEQLPDLAVVPVGTGNDFFRMLGTPARPEEALQVLRQGVRRWHDVGRARWEGGEEIFVNLLGVGVDVEVLRTRARFSRLRGLAQYLAALIVEILRYDSYRIRIRLDGLPGASAGQELIEDSVHLAAVTVGPSAGGGFQLNPGATPDDGYLDLCFVRGLGFFEIVQCVPKVVRGTHGTLDTVRLRRFSAARLERPDGEPMIFQLDGELMPNPVRWLEVDVLPRHLPVLAPPVDADGESASGSMAGRRGIVAGRKGGRVAGKGGGGADEGGRLTGGGS